MKHILSLFIFIILAGTALAQAPQKLNYQGIARNNTGQPLISTTLGLRISVRDLTAGGTVLYQETHTPVTNAYGLYTVAIGTGSVVSGSFAGINWASGDKYMQVEIDPVGGVSYVDAGATQLLSVPYALYAAKAGSAANADSSTKAGSARLVLPYYDSMTNTSTLLKIENPGDGGALEGISNSTVGNASAIKGTISNTSPGGFSSAVRGVNNGTGGLGIGVYGSHAGSGWGVYGSTVSGIGAYGNANGGYGVYAVSNTGTGMYATSTNGNAGTVSITNAANASNALEVNTSGSGRALNVSSASGIATTSTSVTGQAGNFTNTGATNTTTALLVSTAGTGSALTASVSNAANTSNVFAASTTGTGKAGTFNINNTGSTNNIINAATNGIGSGISVQLTNASNGGRGIDVTQSGVGPGVFATSTGGNGVWGITSSISAAGVIGDNTPGECVVGRGNSSSGSGVGAVVGRQDGAGCYGVRGFVTGANGIGVLGQAGISGSVSYAGRFENVNASNTNDVVQIATNAAGANGLFVSVPSSSSKGAVYGIATGSSANGVIGEANVGGSAYGIWGKSTSGYAGYFSGNLYVGGTLSKLGGTFKIDHPADPANKYLIHSFVESPDMMNVYNGNITTNANGIASVDLPSYFEIENIDFKYQLTVIGQFAQAIISQEVSGNKFEIKTDKPNVKVSWQVTGVRNDKFAQQNRVVAEVEKSAEEKGYYLYPAGYGLPESKIMSNSRTKGVVEQPKVLELTGAEKSNTLSNQQKQSSKQ